MSVLSCLSVYLSTCLSADIVHVEASVDPVRDMDIIETELLLADMQMMENRMSRKVSPSCHCIGVHVFSSTCRPARRDLEVLWSRKL